MVAEPWIHRRRSQQVVSSNCSTAPVTKESKPPPDPAAVPAPKKGNTHTIGILAFEVASAMSKAVHLHRSLSASEISRLRGEVLRSHAVRTLVSAEEARLLELAVAEKLDDLGRVAALVSRLGRRCTDQPLVGFEHVFKDLLHGRVEVAKLGFLVKDMGGTVKKMKRYINSTASLYGELEVLNELEQGMKKLQLLNPQPYEETRRAFEQKLQWQRHNVKHLMDVSLWNQTYDKIGRLMARAVCTIYARLRLVFGEAVLASESPNDVSRPLSGQIISGRRRPPQQPNAGKRRSGPIVQGAQTRQAGALRGEAHGFPCGSAPARLFTECLSLTGAASWKVDDGDEHFEGDSCSSRVGNGVPFSGDLRRSKPIRPGSGRSPFAVKNGVAMQAAPTTVGGAALALHYANVIIVIEKLLRYPHLVGEETRDDLYQMLPASLRASVRRSLRSYVKDLAIYDAPLAHDWKERMEKTLTWLAPMAHNMIKWQTERNFEQQQIGSRANVLLLQTLYFADREKTEAAMCELLVGLNYICRYEHQQSALLDCTSSLDFDECMDWQLQ